MITKYNEFEKINEELIGSILLGGFFTFVLVSIIKAKLWKLNGDPYALGNWNAIKLIYRWIKTFKSYRKYMSKIKKIDKDLEKRTPGIKYDRNKILGLYTYGYGEQTSISTYLSFLRGDLLAKCDPNNKKDITEILNDFEDEVSEIIKDGRSHYLDWSKKLDKSMINNDIAEFSKIYNIGNSRWKEKYKSIHPEHVDIIDGANIGLFSMKTE